MQQLTIIACRVPETRARAFSIIISWSRVRNSQELMDSTTGVVLAPKVQPGTYLIMKLLMGCHFATPAEARSQLSLQLHVGMLKQWV